MLKEELEKQLGVKVSMAFYVTANGMYVQGPYRNNVEFCEMLKLNKLLMVSLRESARMRNLVREAHEYNRQAYEFTKQLESSMDIRL